MLKLLFLVICVVLCSCSDMGGGQYRYNSETIGEFFRTGKFIQDKSVAMRADAPENTDSGGGAAMAVRSRNAHFEGNLLKIRKGCLRNIDPKARNPKEKDAVLSFDNDRYGFLIPLNRKMFEECFCADNRYCEFTVANVKSRDVADRNGEYDDYYYGYGKVIEYRKMK